MHQDASLFAMQVRRSPLQIHSISGERLVLAHELTLGGHIPEVQLLVVLLALLEPPWSTACTNVLPQQPFIEARVLAPISQFVLHQQCRADQVQHPYIAL